MLPDAQMDTKMIIWKLSQVARSQSDTKKSMAKVERTKQLASDIQQLKYSVEIAALNAGVLRFLGVTVAFWTQKKPRRSTASTKWRHKPKPSRRKLLEGF